MIRRTNNYGKLKGFIFAQTFQHSKCIWYNIGKNETTIYNAQRKDHDKPLTHKMCGCRRKKHTHTKLLPNKFQLYITQHNMYVIWHESESWSTSDENIAFDYLFSLCGWKFSFFPLYLSVSLPLFVYNNKDIVMCEIILKTTASTLWQAVFPFQCHSSQIIIRMICERCTREIELQLQIIQ